MSQPSPEVISVGPLPMPVPVRWVAAGVAPLDGKLRAGRRAAHLTLTFPKIPGRDGAGNLAAREVTRRGLILLP